MNSLPDLNKLQSLLAFNFKHEALLRQALVHTSYINENPGTELHDNQRMEFLGDALLNCIVAEALYHEYPDLPEGKLTEIRISLVRQEKLAEKAGSLNLGKFMLLGKGEDLSGGRHKCNNLADTFEAVIAALFLDLGFEATKEFVLKHLGNDIQSFRHGHVTANFKALLQELTQAKYKSLPEYEIVETSGPDHDRVFIVSVSVGDTILAIGTGKSKKAAESQAARIALEKLS